jgi:hypothetical protein
LTLLLEAYKKLETPAPANHNPVSAKPEKRDLATLMDEIEQAGYANADGGLLTNDRNWHALRQAFNLVSDIDLVAEAVVTRDAQPEPTVLDFQHRGYYVQLERKRAGWDFIIYRPLVSAPLMKRGPHQTSEHARMHAINKINSRLDFNEPW